MPPQVRADELVGPHPRAWKPLYKAEKIAGIAVAALALYLATNENLGWVPFVVGSVAALVLLFVNWPYGATLELLIAASMPRWVIPIGSWHAKPEHFVVAACGLMLLLRIFTQQHQWQPPGKVGWLLLAFLAMNFLSSTVTSPQRDATLRWALLLTLAVSPFFFLWQIVRTRKQLDKVMILWLRVGALGALFGIFCFLSYLTFRTNLGVSVFDFLGFIPEVHGSLWEPNIFGSYCTCFSVMFLFYFLDGVPRNPWHLAGFLVTTVGVVLSFARQGWISLVVVGGLILLYSLSKGKVGLKHLAPIIASILIALVVGIMAMVDLSDRMSSLTGDVGEDPTVARRIGMVALATQDIQEHPVMGLGTSSFQLLYIADSDTTYQGVDNAWLGSFFFGIMHDTGLIGMILFLWLLVELSRRTWRVLAEPVRAPARTAVGALSAGVLVMLIAYQFTDASTLAFTWIQFGLMAAALRIAEASEGDTALESR